MPITATQFGMNRVLEGVYTTVLGASPDNLGKVVVAMGAGSASAMFSCPAEFVIIQQQKSCRPMMAEVRSIVSTYGALAMYKGMVRQLVVVTRSLGHREWRCRWSVVVHTNNHPITASRWLLVLQLVLINAPFLDPPLLLRRARR